LPKPGFACIERAVAKRREIRSPMSLPRYDLTDLRLFIHVAEAGNLTRGAERSHLSLGAASLRAVGLHRATDLAGGFTAWREAGFPVGRGPADVRR